MVGKLRFLVGFGAGYVLGARAGRARYEQIAQKAQQVWRDPRVQEQAGKAQRVVQEKAGQAGEAVKDKVGSGGSSDGDDPSGRPDLHSGVAATTATGAGGTALP